MLQRLYFELRYLLGDTPWDSGETPPEVHQYLRDHPPGRAVDLGCGTGTNAITLAHQGWEVAGIDLSVKAIASARRKAAREGVDVVFVRGDASRALEYEMIEGPFDLALDIGCLHALPTGLRPAYAEQIASLVGAGGSYLLYAFLDDGREENSRWPAEVEIREHFAEPFQLDSVEHGTFRERPSAWFTFRRQS